MSVPLEYYEKDKIGRLIAWSSDHFVYDYDKDKVIKFSVFELMFGKNGRTKIKYDYSICKQFFGKYILETVFKKSRNGKWTGTIQPKITGHYLFKQDLDDKSIRQQFSEIMTAYNALIRAGHRKIDLIGQGGGFRNLMSNIFVTPNNQLFIFDATLLEHKGSGIFRPFFFILFLFIHWRQNYVIKYFTH